MLERSARRASLVAISFVSMLALTACGGNDSKPAPSGAAAATKPDPQQGQQKPPQDEAKEPTALEPKADVVAGPPDGESAGDEGKSDDAGAAEGGEAADAESGAEADAEGGEPAAEEDGDDPAADGGGDDAAAEGGGGADSAALIKEARTTKTTDERAVAALAEAEAAGATVKELARAAKARGDYLYKAPERAQVFYEWAAAKDEDYPDPVFALAKQKAVTGDVTDVVKLLTQVSERKGGKKLLEQIDFDPTWDIVKDDPDVRALL